MAAGVKSGPDGSNGIAPALGPDGRRLGVVQDAVGAFLAEQFPGLTDQVLAPAQIGAASRAVAAQPRLWSRLVPAQRPHRWYALLHRRANYDVWLLAWDPGHETDWHDHGGSSGSFAVAGGRLMETFRRPRTGSAGTRRVGAGDAVTFGPSHVHNVTHLAGAPALSIHVYSPALVAMTYYERTPYGFSAFETVAVDSPHGTRSRVSESEVQFTDRDRQAIDELLASARRGLERRPVPREAAEAVAAGATLVDLRPAGERAVEGAIPGSVAIERNVLEWRLDPQSEYRIPELASYDAEIILLCTDGYASSLAAATLRRMGLTRVTDLDGGYHAWKAAGLPTVGG
ncbi:MAG: rhodanese-like domain-containing protein [Acidimicrobiales bacterium]